MNTIRGRVGEGVGLRTSVVVELPSKPLPLSVREGAGLWFTSRTYNAHLSSSEC